MAKLTSAQRGGLSDSDFAYVEPGHAVNGKTPDQYRHFPIHDAAHVRNALARIGQGARFGDKAKAKVMAAAKKHGVDSGDTDTGRALESLYPEIRFYSDTPEVRQAEGDDVKHIVGYASVFNSVSRRLGGFHEKVLPTAFERAKSDGWPNVVCRFNHEPNMVLGTTGADTCRLAIDEHGLKYDVIPPNHRGDVMELVERRDVRYSSFAFRCVDEDGDTWEKSEYGLPMRSLHSVELVDVAPVMDPAYGDTTAVARNMAGAIASLARWVDGDPDEVRAIMQAGQANRFFSRTDRPSAPKLDKASAESRAVDDQALAIRAWKYEEDDEEYVETPDEPTDDATTEENARPTDEEVRAALKNMGHDQICKQWVDGQPCVRPTGHDGEHAPLCWAQKAGMPCHMPQGHDGDHEPLNVKTRNDETPAEEPESDLDLETARAMLDKFEEINLD